MKKKKKKNENFKNSMAYSPLAHNALCNTHILKLIEKNELLPIVC